jgi:hypothetical protein
MTLASLAHEATKAAPAFNGLFYATAATIIPVLFLAVAVQGRTYESLLTTLSKLQKRLERPGDPDNSGLYWQVINGLAFFIILFGTLGEIYAVLSLYWQRPEGPQVIAVSVVLLTITVTGGPTLAYGRIMVDFSKAELGLSRKPAASPDKPNGRPDQVIRSYTPPGSGQDCEDE